MANIQEQIINTFEDSTSSWMLWVDDVNGDVCSGGYTYEWSVNGWVVEVYDDCEYDDTLQC